ncbi:MAG: ribose-phosphate pyrophosphokinase, partial [Alphaproteobacteria bacterium]|nr:ribose-phosphate pyrophosphokinase [Alphaproteobacteria bacterium]
GIPLMEVSIKRFADQEIFIEILDNVRGEDVFVIQSTSYPANDHLMEMLIMFDALKRGSVHRITAVMPYFGYARQDRKTGPRTPISAKLVANLITTAGADRVLTMDLHAGQIQGFFDIPVDNLFAGTSIFIPYVQKTKSTKPLTMISPDVGGVMRARALAKRLDAGLAIIDKRREKAGVSEVMHVIGDVEGQECIMIDDMVDSAGTLCNAAKALMENGAASVRALATHGVFSGSAVERIEKSPLTEMIITDSIAATENNATSKKIKHLTIAPLIGEAILRISEERSVSSLFDTVMTGE